MPIPTAEDVDCSAQIFKAAWVGSHHLLDTQIMQPTIYSIHITEMHQTLFMAGFENHLVLGSTCFETPSLHPSVNIFSSHLRNCPSLPVNPSEDSPGDEPPDSALRACSSRLPVRLAWDFMWLNTCHPRYPRSDLLFDAFRFFFWCFLSHGDTPQFSSVYRLGFPNLKPSSLLRGSSTRTCPVVVMNDSMFVLTPMVTWRIFMWF